MAEKSAKEGSSVQNGYEHKMIPIKPMQGQYLGNEMHQFFVHPKQ